MVLPSDRSRTVGQAYVWASRASSIGLSAVIPIVFGYWGDRNWGTTPWLVIVGACVGFIAMMQELIWLSRKIANDTNRSETPPVDDAATRND